MRGMVVGEGGRSSGVLLYDESAGRRPTASSRSPRGSNASYRLPRIVTHRVRDRMPSRVTGYNGFIVVPPKVISVAATRVSWMIPGYGCLTVSPILGSVHQFESRTRLKAKDLQARVVVDSSQDKYMSRLLKMMHQRFYGKYELNRVRTIARAWNKWDCWPKMATDSIIYRVCQAYAPITLLCAFVAPRVL